MNSESTYIKKWYRIDIDTKRKTILECKCVAWFYSFVYVMWKIFDGELLWRRTFKFKMLKSFGTFEFNCISNS